MQKIETERLILRPFTYDDLEAFALIGSDPDVMRFIGDGKPQSCDQTVKVARFYNKELKYYAITRDEYERENAIGSKKRRPQFD
jgi:RimJ/RimL family protein N-acetyltransferase